MKDNTKSPTATERYLSTHSSFEEVMQLMDSTGLEKIQDTVHLTQQEINNGKMRKKEMQAKAKTFANTPIYRAYHNVVTITLQIIELMPKKTVKISDIMLSKLTDAIQWSAAAYEQRDPYLKHNSLGEAISLMYVFKICANSSSSLNLIGKSKSAQLTKSMDQIIRQLVAWRDSLKGEGSNGDEQ